MKHVIEKMSQAQKEQYFGFLQVKTDISRAMDNPVFLAFNCPAVETNINNTIKALDYQLKLCQFDALVTVHAPETVTDDESTLMRDCKMKVLQYISATETTLVDADIYCKPRVPDDAPDYKHPGWCEYLIVLEFEAGNKLVIGAVQRTKGATTEFHS